jgi:hypothetical protein
MTSHFKLSAGETAGSLFRLSWMSDFRPDSYRRLKGVDSFRFSRMVIPELFQTLRRDFAADAMSFTAGCILVAFQGEPEHAGRTGNR